MPSISEDRTLPEPKRKKWVRPVLTVIIVIGILIFLTDGEILEPFVYSRF